ncbi:MAG: hypothetical protein JNN04_05715 [Cyclobacteriaceae bacterium]|nr:hypothetical protein [Cyclobacteriaceae bacterium]
MTPAPSILCFCFLVFLLSCEDEDFLLSRDEEETSAHGFTEQMSPITGTDLPGTCRANVKLTFEVEHGVYNGCGQYSRHETFIKGKDIYVTFFAKYPTEAFCTSNAPIRSTNYMFIPSSPGEYTFHFKQTETKELVQVLVVI